MSPSNSPKKSPLKSRDDGEGTGGFTGKPLFSPSTPVATGERLRGLKPQNTSFESPELHVGRRYNNPVVKPTPRRSVRFCDALFLVVCVCLCVHACVCICTYVCACVCVHAYAYCMYVYVYMCMCVWLGNTCHTSNSVGVQIPCIP